MSTTENRQAVRIMATAKRDTSIIRSSTAEYLTFVAGSGNSDVNAIYADENVWLPQKMIALLYDVNVRTVNEHLKNIFSDSELEETSVIRNFRITASDGKTYDTMHYNLSALSLHTLMWRRIWLCVKYP
jgi:hypothetical protein